MNRSRHRNWNRVDAASLARWIVLTAFLALAGLSYVYLTLQLYHLGDRKTIRFAAPPEGRLFENDPNFRA